MRHSVLSCVLVVSAAACAASGSDSSTHGPIFGDDAGDASNDASADATSDSAADAHADASADTGADASADAIADASADAIADASTDARDASSCTATMAVFAGSASSLAAAIYSGGQWGAASSLTGSASAPPAVTAFGNGYVAVVAQQATLPSLLASVYTSSWSSPSAVGTLGAKDTLGLAVVGANVHLTFLGSADSKFYHGTYNGTSWDAANDPVGGSGAQSFGASGSTAAAASAKLVVAQSGSNNSVYDQTWDSSWQAAHQQTGTSVEAGVAPTLVAMNGAADLMIVFVRKTDFHLMWSTRTGGNWSTPAEVYNSGGNVAYSNDPVAVAARPGGKAALVFRGGNMVPYTTLFDGSAWSAPAELVTGMPTLAAPPSIASGVCGDDAVAAYATGGVVNVVRLIGTTWGSPTAISGASGMKYAAIATHP